MVPAWTPTQPSQWCPGSLSSWVDASGLPVFHYTPGFVSPAKPHHLFTWLLQPGSWGLMEKISNLVWRFLLGMCFLNWVSLSLGGLSIHPTDFILTPALVPRLFQLLSPQPHPCSSTNELASTYLKNTCGAWFRPSCHHCLHISWSVVCGADLPGVFLKKCRFLCPTSSPSYTHRIQFSGLGAREVHYKQEPRRCWYSLQFEKQCYILFDCLNNLVREILLLKSELYGEHPTWTLSPSFLVHQIVVYFHQFHWPFPHPQIKKHSLPPLIKSESSLKGCLWSKPSFCNCPTVFGHSDTFFFFTPFSLRISVWKTSTDISSSSLIPSLAMSNLLVSPTTVFFISVMVFLASTTFFWFLCRISNSLLTLPSVLVCYPLFSLQFLAYQSQLL